MVITRTPFRISFFGGGTDYPAWYKKHKGMVISTSINKYCYITTRFLPPFFEYKYRIRYTNKELVNKMSEIVHPSVRECLKYLKIKDGIEMVHTSDVPANSGLGSSSAFTVGFLNSLYGMKNIKTSKKFLAEKAIFIEQEKIKENVGSQDQIAVACGGFNKIEFSKKEINILPIKTSKKNLKLLEDHMILIFSGFQRRASDIASSLVSSIPKKDLELGKILETTFKAEEILNKKNLDIFKFGKLLDEYWQIKRSLTSGITNSLINDIYENAISQGAIGGKILGAGGGGFFLFLVPPKKQAKFIKTFKELIYVPFKFENLGSEIIYNMPGDAKNGYSW